MYQDKETLLRLFSKATPREKASMIQMFLMKHTNNSDVILSMYEAIPKEEKSAVNTFLKGGSK